MTTSLKRIAIVLLLLIVALLVTVSAYRLAGAVPAAEQQVNSDGNQLEPEIPAALFSIL